MIDQRLKYREGGTDNGHSNVNNCPDFGPRVGRQTSTRVIGKDSFDKTGYDHAKGIYQFGKCVTGIENGSLQCTQEEDERDGHLALPREL